MSDRDFTTVIFSKNALLPATAADLERIAERYRPGTPLKAELSQPRSLKHHRLYWGVLRMVVEGTGAWANAEGLSETIKENLRMFASAAVIADGAIRVETQSLSFDEMDQGCFKIFFEQAMTEVGEMTGIDMGRIIRAVKRQIGWTAADEKAVFGARACHVQV